MSEVELRNVAARVRTVPLTLTLSRKGRGNQRRPLTVSPLREYREREDIANCPDTAYSHSIVAGGLEEMS